MNRVINVPNHQNDGNNNLTELAKSIKTTNIRGKAYVEVSERVRVFHRIYPKGKIVTELIYGEGGHYIMKATVYPDSNCEKRYFTGHAHEDEAKGQINNTSAIENCETSATGRALGLLGLGSELSIASAEEVQNAIHQQTKKGGK